MSSVSASFMLLCVDHLPVVCSEELCGEQNCSAMSMILCVHIASNHAVQFVTQLNVKVKSLHTLLLIDYIYYNTIFIVM